MPAVHFFELLKEMEKDYKEQKKQMKKGTKTLK